MVQNQEQKITGTATSFKNHMEKEKYIYMKNGLSLF